MSEIKALKGEMTTLKEEVKNDKGQSGAQGKNQEGVVKAKLMDAEIYVGIVGKAEMGSTCPISAIKPRETYHGCHGTDSSRGMECKVSLL